MADSNAPKDALKQAKGMAKEVVGAVTGRDDLVDEGRAEQGKRVRPDLAGAPAPQPPSFEEPTEPRPPLPPKPDQGAPELRSATGTPADGPADTRAQQGRYLTTAQGARLYDTDHSLKAGDRGPTLLQDHHFREKITHFDHERIPERVVHARGAGAHGVFRANGAAEKICKAEFLKSGVETEVFVRFSTVIGNRGSMDTARDTRGFATKFYTGQGTFDLVGNNIPVFFIQDGIKFPDVVHAAKPHPDREIPQAQTAHDTFWDFFSLHTESAAHTMWAMSDRGIPRSYRTMEGFGVNTFRLIAPDETTSLVKFHWKPRLGVHSLIWEEAQIIGGVDPDFHRRDLADAIEAGAFPEWDLGVQVFPDNPEQMFEGIDLLDPTKIVPEELAPVQIIGTLQLNRNVTNFFAETEQVAFHPGHLVPGIDITDDPLMQARLFSYLDTQLLRLGGPNFAQIPINRPHAPVNDMLRDGFHQHGVHAGVAPYQPNSLDGGCPFMASAETGAFIEAPHPLPASAKRRANPATFDDHFSQATLFYRSLHPVEQAHVAAAFSFEIGKCYEQTIKERALAVLANIDAELCATVAAALGLEAPRPSVPPVDPETLSPALSQLGSTWPIEGRRVGILTGPDTDVAAVATLVEALLAADLVPHVTAVHGGELGNGEVSVPVSRTYLTGRSVEFDAIVVAGSPADMRARIMVDESYRHLKPVAVLPAGENLVTAAGVPVDTAGVALESDPARAASTLITALGAHRVWDRPVRN
ncbi:catalase [Mycolicibacterium thermoresistibile]|uniref:Catalase n=2 Tax=Mycolicibacterium thermoresistibile TaxID=1797 RepID=G7CCT7_MYCT3|nr:catalase [Mycolicibacterium thermoresistibile]EHI14186.1 catalase [Mycolicibacterium thermoresistibile ATCC 19527]MCV7187285.1 catalase [Mycolicibacterium thermoresistibile]GAT16499.1 catalase [Mycolicibacterium thermoresistibile]SNW20584.1 catalase [Mycolicibacterium thermoresistibile]